MSVNKLILILLAAALILSYNINKPFWGHHDFNNAFYGVMGRNLARFGPVATKLGQVTTTSVSDPKLFGYHTHHPPLLIWLLGLSYFLFGISEISTRLIPVIFSVATVAVFFLLIREVFGQKTAVASSMIWLVTPIFVYFGKMAVHEVLVLFFFVSAVYTYLKGQYKLLLPVISLGCLSGWPAYYIPVIILFLDFFQKKNLGLARSLFILIIPVFFFLLLLGHNYILTGSPFGGGLLEAYFFRTEAIPVIDYFRREASWFLAYFSKPVFLAAVLGAMLALKNMKSRIFLLAFGLYGLIYLVVFKSAAYRHDYLIYYFLPLFAASAGFLVARIHKYAFIVLLALSVLSSYKFTQALLASDYMKEGVIVGKMVHDRVPKDESVAIIDDYVVNDSSWQAVFYADRVITILPIAEKPHNVKWILSKNQDGIFSFRQTK